MSAVADATIDAKTASFMAKSCPAAITKACSRAHTHPLKCLRAFCARSLDDLRAPIHVSGPRNRHR
eukprot:COSAG05_NODE_7927_length_754_cov_972.206107_1_plen_65_part_10